MMSGMGRGTGLAGILGIAVLFLVIAALVKYVFLDERAAPRQLCRSSFPVPPPGRAGALSGPVMPADDENLLYRIDRVHLNSVEALSPFVVPAVLAMMVGVRANLLALLVWIHVAIRLAQSEACAPS